MTLQHSFLRNSVTSTSEASPVDGARVLLFSNYQKSKGVGLCLQNNCETKESHQFLKQEFIRSKTTNFSSGLLKFEGHFPSGMAATRNELSDELYRILSSRRLHGCLGLSHLVNNFLPFVSLKQYVPISSCLLWKNGEGIQRTDFVLSPAQTHYHL